MCLYFTDKVIAPASQLEGMLQDRFGNNGSHVVQAMVPAVLNGIAFVLNAGQEAAAQESLELFIEVAESHPRFLRRQLGEVLTAMLQVTPSISS